MDEEEIDVCGCGHCDTCSVQRAYKQKLETMTRERDAAREMSSLNFDRSSVLERNGKILELAKEGYAEAMKAHKKRADDAELQNSAYFDQTEWAWSIIASAGPEGCIGNWEKMDPKWKSAAEAWRDKWHELLNARVTVNRKCEHKKIIVNTFYNEAVSVSARKCADCGEAVAPPDAVKRKGETL